MGNLALSIRQPWAWGIFHAGKDVENRDWSDRSPSLHMAKRLIGYRIWIHVGQSLTRDEYDDFIDTARHVVHVSGHPLGVTLPPMDHLPLGGIIGSVMLRDVVTVSASLWFFGRIGLVVSDPEPCEFRSMKGALGFFPVSP